MSAFEVGELVYVFVERDESDSVIALILELDLNFSSLVFERVLVLCRDRVQWWSISFVKKIYCGSR